MPEALRDRIPQQDGKIQLALQKSYQLLSCLPDDPLGTLYQPYADSLSNILQVRNNSLFAHGFQPITASDYRTVSATISGFIKEGIEAVADKEPLSPAEQFPQSLAG